MSVTTADVSAVWRASSPSDRAYAVGVPAIIAVVAVVMVPGLRVPLWFDESVTATTVTRGIGQTVEGLATADGGFAGYLVAMTLWSSVGGDSEAWLRLPSLIAVLVTIALAAELGRRISGPVCGLTAAALLAVNRELVSEYACEARPYAITTMLVTIVALLAHRASRNGYTMGSIIAIGSVIAAATTVHALSIVCLAMLIPWLLSAARVSSWTARLRTIATFVVIADVGVVLLMLALAARYSDLQSWISNPSPVEWLQMVVETATIGTLVCGISAEVWCAAFRVRIMCARVDAATLALWALGPLLILVVAGYLYRPMLQSAWRPAEHRGGYAVSSTGAFTVDAASRRVGAPRHPRERRLGLRVRLPPIRPDLARH